MSGAGKSTILAELGALGHQVVDTDDGDWVVAGPEPLWDDALMTALLDTPQPGHLFLAGCVANQGRFHPRFDAVVLLTAPLDVLLERVGARANPFGRTAADRARIAADTAEVEPLLRRGATAVVDTRRPLAEVVDAVLGCVLGR